MTAENILANAAASGYDTVCFTNHLWDAAVEGASAWYAPQHIDHVRRLLPLPTAAGVRVCFGCETEYCGHGKLGLTPEHFGLFDFVAIPLNHLHFRGFVSPERPLTAEETACLLTERMEEIITLPLPFRKVGIAHLTTGLMYTQGRVRDVVKHMKQERVQRVFGFLAAQGSGIELNNQSFQYYDEDREELLALYRMAKAEGCLFYCASDAHRWEELDISFLSQVADDLRLEEKHRYMIP